MPVRNEGKWGKEGGDNQGTTRIWTAASEDPEKPQMPAANQAFLWAEAPLAEGGDLGERSCFWSEAPGNAGLGPGGPAAGFRACTAATIVTAEGPSGLV